MNMNISEVDYRELIESKESGNTAIPPNFDLLKHVEVSLEIKVGQAVISVGELFKLQAGSVLTLDRNVDEPVEILLNGHTIAAGYLAVSGENLGVRITEIRNDNSPR
jgi:flagellar motor switch protein FliN/FliY